MTRALTEVALRCTEAADPRWAAARVTARPGELTVEVRGGRRVLRVGTDVVSARFDDDVRLAGRVAFDGPDGQAVAVLDLDDWVPPVVAASGFCRGGLEDPLVWTGLGQLATVAGVPVHRSRVAEVRTVVPVPSGPSRAVVAASVGLSLTGVCWVLALIVASSQDGRPALPEVLLGVCSLLALFLFLEQRVRHARTYGIPAGTSVEPRPSVPVTRRFRRGARLVLQPGSGPLDLLVVRHPDRRQQWFDGPDSPLGLHRAVVVTPPGATEPERVDLLDGLGRAPVRLPWAQWFGSDDSALDVLSTRGLLVERTEGASLGPAADGLLAPRSSRYPYADFLQVPGAFHNRPMIQLAGAVSLVPVLLWLRATVPVLTLHLGVLNLVLFFGPGLVRVATRPWFDVPR